MSSMQWQTLSQFDLPKKYSISICIKFLVKMLKWENGDRETRLRPTIKTGWPRKRPKC